VATFFTLPALANCHSPARAQRSPFPKILTKSNNKPQPSRRDSSHILSYADALITPTGEGLNILFFVQQIVFMPIYSRLFPTENLFV
jgi:hypothetical protein